MVKFCCVIQIHLLPDADELLSELYPDYNLANVLTCGGVFFVLVMEQLTFIFARKPNENKSVSDMLQKEVCSVVETDQDLRDSLVRSNTNTNRSSTDHRQSVDSVYDSSKPGIRRNSNSCEIRKNSKFREARVISNIQESELDLFTNVLNSNSLRDLITAYVMEISIAVHSIIIGVDLGLLGQGEITTLISLMIALGFHQFVEGIGLGTTIQNSQSSLGSTKVATFIVIFSSTMSLGIFVGIITSSSPESDTQTAFKGVANAIAAGSLMYISLTEMVGSYFNEPDLVDQPWLKIGMMLSFGLGIAFMAVIAVWA